MDATTKLSILRDVIVLFVGAVLGFGASYFQWKLSLARADIDRKREKLELLHMQLNRWADVIRYTIHKRNNEGFYYPDPGPDPGPNIRTLTRLYAPEFRSHLGAIYDTYFSTVESQLKPNVKTFDPILQGITDLANQVRGKLEAMEIKPASRWTRFYQWICPNHKATVETASAVPPAPTAK